jgi:DNA-binding protein HU-beta
MINKDVLVAKITDRTRLKNREVEEVVDFLLEEITNKLAAGEKVSLTGFGAFEVRDRKGRRGVDPRTLEPMQIPTVKVAKFRAGKTLKEAVK